MNSKQFIKELDKGTVMPAYLFLGPEEGEKEKALLKIAGILAKTRHGEIDTARFHIENGEFMQALEFAMTQSMFSSGKICVMYNINTLPAQGSNSSQFQDLLSTLPDTTTLILTSEENRPPKIMSSAPKGSFATIQFWHPFDNDIRNHILGTLKGHGITIEPNAVQRMMRCTGNDMRKVDSAMEKIVSSGRNVIDEACIADIILFEKDISVFEFLDALFKKSPASFSLFKRLQEEGVHDLAVLTMITRHAENIERFHSLRKSMPDSDALRELKIPDRKSDEFLRSADKFPPGTFPDLFHSLYSCESSLKGKRLSKRFIANPVVTLISDMIL